MNRLAGIITANYSTDDMGILTEERGIASMPFGGRYRLIDFALSNMVNSEVDVVGLIMPYKYRSLIDHTGAGSEFTLDRKRGGLNILPGTAFGISNRGSRFTLRDIRNNNIFFERATEDYFVLTASHFIFNMDFNDMLDYHIKSGADITMAYTDEIDICHQANSIQIENGVVKKINKGSWPGQSTFIDTFIISRDLLMKIIECNEAVDYMDFFDLLGQEIDRYNVRAYEFNGYVRSIASINDYYKVNMDLLKEDVYDSLFIDERPIRTKVQDCVPSRFLPGSSIVHSLVSSGCNVEGTVDGSVIFRGCTIEKGATVKNSIIMQSCVIKSGAYIEHAIIDRNNVVGSNMTIKGTKDNLFIMEKSGKKR
jgi:glucose-1-phosphate adenylyltransferase